MAEPYDFRGIHDVCPTCGVTNGHLPGPRYSVPPNNRTAARWWCWRCLDWTDKMVELAYRFDEPKNHTIPENKTQQS